MFNLNPTLEITNLAHVCIPYVLNSTLTFAGPIHNPTAWGGRLHFFSGHLNLRTTPKTGLPSRKKKS